MLLEDLRDVGAGELQRGDRHDRDQRDDERVLDEGLALLAV
jgi:hypothetical protein